MQLKKYIGIFIFFSQLLFIGMSSTISFFDSNRNVALVSNSFEENKEESSESLDKLSKFKELLSNRVITQVFYIQPKSTDHLYMMNTDALYLSESQKVNSPPPEIHFI